MNSVRVIGGGERERGKEAVGLRIEMEQRTAPRVGRIIRLLVLKEDECCMSGEHIYELPVFQRLHFDASDRIKDT